MTDETSADLDALEIQRLRDRVRQLEAAIEPAPARRDRRDARVPLAVSIEFVTDFDLLEAEAVDVSAGGICFDVDQPLRFLLRIRDRWGGSDRRAELVWAHRTEDEDDARTRVGFRFLDENNEPINDKLSPDEDLDL